MEHISEKLKKDEVLNPETLKRVQQFIHQKYPGYSSEQKAGVLADSLHKMIERSLPEVSKNEKIRIRKHVFHQTISSGSLIVSRLDLVEASIEMIGDDESMSLIISWITQLVDGDREIVERFIKERVAEGLDAEDKNKLDVESPSSTSDGKVHLQKRLPLLNCIKVKNINYIWAGACILLLTFLLGLEKWSPNEKEVDMTQSSDVTVNRIEPEEYQGPYNELPSSLQYQPVNEGQLQQWLLARDSLLADEPYFSSIIAVSQEFNVHPFLLFAITGQEQAYVPRSHENAEEMANNPFNVFYSWQDFNTSITESTQIAARTIVNLSEGRPDEFHPIKWINRKYAEDENWWVGVNSIFEQLEEEIQGES